MRNRRSNRRNRRNRRGRFAFLYRMLAFIVACGCIVFALAWFFKIEKISVSGNSRYETDQIIECSQLKEGQNLFFFNKYKVVKRICSELPYVESVSVSRFFPNEVVLRVSECDSAAAVSQDGQLWLISGEGKIVDAVSTDQQSEYAVVTGITLTDPCIGEDITSNDETKEQTNLLLSFLENADKKDILGRIQKIDLTDSTCIIFSFDTRFTVKILKTDDLDYRLDYLLAVVEKLDANESGTIDLTQEDKASFIPG